MTNRDDRVFCSKGIIIMYIKYKIAKPKTWVYMIFTLHI